MPDWHLPDWHRIDYRNCDKWSRINPVPTSPAAASTRLPMARRAKIDEYAVLEQWYLQNKPKLDRRKELATEIQTWFEDDKEFKPALAIRAEAATCFLDLAPRKDMRRITKPHLAFNALKHAMGIDALVAAITITFKVLDRYVTDEDQKSYVATEPTGPRTITVVPKAAA